MSTAAKYKEVSTYSALLAEHNNDYKAVEEKIIKDLAKFTDKPFGAMTWNQKIEGNSKDRIAYFGPLKILNDEFVKVVRLWVILESNAKGVLYAEGGKLSPFVKYLNSKKLNFKNIRVNEIKAYEEHLDRKKTRKRKLLEYKTKKEFYRVILSFFTVMQGHPLVAEIDNISAFSNPYLGLQNNNNNCESKNVDKEIPQEKLDIMDAYFKDEGVPLTLRVWYWLMRMYGARPLDVLSYPLDCVKMFDEIEQLATIKTYVGKQNVATQRIDPTEKRPYLIKFLNLKEPTQKMLYDLVKEQQEYATQLQNKADRKNFLMTSLYYVGAQKLELVRIPTIGWFNDKWREKLEPLFKDGEYPAKKWLKNTGLIKRAYWGTHPHYALRSVANQQSNNTVDDYINKSSPKRAIDLQKDIEDFTIQTNIAWEFKGQSVHDLQNIIAKVKENPHKHQLPGLGFCPDASACGNHFECVGCDYLVPHPELKEYYLDQAEEYRDRAKRLQEIGEHHEYRDRMIVASKFYNLYLRSMDEEYKELGAFEMMDLKEIFGHGE